MRVCPKQDFTFKVWVPWWTLQFTGVGWGWCSDVLIRAGLCWEHTEVLGYSFRDEPSSVPDQDSSDLMNTEALFNRRLLCHVLFWGGRGGSNLWSRGQRGTSEFCKNTFKPGLPKKRFITELAFISFRFMFKVYKKHKLLLCLFQKQLVEHFH